MLSGRDFEGDGFGSDFEFEGGVGLEFDEGFGEIFADRFVMNCFGNVDCNGDLHL